MTQKERANALKHFQSTSLEDLEKEFWNDFNHGYTDTERMYDMGYDIVDCVEMDKVNKYNAQYSDMLQKYLTDHGRDPFEDFYKEVKSPVFASTEDF